MSTKDENAARDRAYREFDLAPAPSTGRILDDAIKITSRIIEGIKREAFEGFGYKDGKANTSDGLVRKVEKMTAALTKLVEADTKYRKAEAARAKTMTPEQYREVIKKFILTELKGPARGEFIKELATDYVALVSLNGGNTLLDSNALKALDATLATQDPSSPAG